MRTLCWSSPFARLFTTCTGACDSSKMPTNDSGGDSLVDAALKRLVILVQNVPSLKPKAVVYEHALDTRLRFGRCLQRGVLGQIAAFRVAADVERDPVVFAAMASR